MDKMSAVTVIACLVSISIVMQGADVKNCATPKMTACSTTYTGSVAGAGGNKRKICSAANTYLDCLNKVVTDCKLDSGSSFISQTIAAAKQAFSQYGCGSGADAQDCATPKMTACSTTYTSSVAGAGGNKRKICNAANTYLDCLNKVVTDCKLDSGSSFISQTIAAAKQALSQYGCGSGNGAGSLVFNLVAMVSGFTFYKLF